MKIPFIRYIEALVLAKMTPNQIFGKLSEVDFNFPLDGVEVVYRTLHTTYPEYFEGKNTDTAQWLEELGVDKMVAYLNKYDIPKGIDGIKGAFNILNDPLMYRLITSLALAKINDQDIDLIVNGKYNNEYSSDDIDEFLHYFFDVKDWSLNDKAEYIEVVDNGDLKKFYKFALKGDKDYLIWKLGAAPDKSFDLMLRDMMMDAYYNFKERSKTDPDIAQRWGALALKLTDRIDKLEKDTGEKKNIFEEIEFRLTQTSIKSDEDIDESLDADMGPIKHLSELE